MTNKAMRFIQNIANVHFTKTSNISVFKNPICSNTFKIALMSQGAKPSQTLLARRLRQSYCRRHFCTDSQYILHHGKVGKDKARPGKGDSLLYFSVVTLFMYMNVVNYSNNK